MSVREGYQNIKTQYSFAKPLDPSGVQEHERIMSAHVHEYLS
jgi:hypothetical protein